MWHIRRQLLESARDPAPAAQRPLHRPADVYLPPDAGNILLHVQIPAINALTG